MKHIILSILWLIKELAVRALPNDYFEDWLKNCLLPVQNEISQFFSSSECQDRENHGPASK